MPLQTKAKSRLGQDVKLRHFVMHDAQNFGEEGQSLDMKFCWAHLAQKRTDDFGLVIETYKGLTDFLQCKDFLHDHVVADDFKDPFKIYSYPADVFPVKSRDELLLITNTKECPPLVYEARLIACLRQFEKAAGLKSEIVSVKWADKNPPLAESIAISPDPLYFKAPFGISMLSYLCRIALLGGAWPECIPAVASLQLKDTGIAQTIKEYGPDKLTERFTAALANATYPENLKPSKNGDDIHFYGGIQSTLYAAMNRAYSPVSVHYGKLFKCG